MKLLSKVSGWARRGVLAVGALLMTLVALIATTATAHAGLDDELTLVDGKGRLLRIQQWDTFLNGVFPLDRNRLTREWFHSGRAVSSYVQTTNLLPSAGINVDLGNGPGIQEVATFSVAVAGPKGAVAVSNAHGTVTGAAGGVLLRPYARLISSAGDSVTTYGETWDMK
ncbi:porin [Mycobacteroides franklinii]|uniref:Porin n=1 Tax=Mycobacteroides franklinii TaxID=948102 RepID=A0A4R5P6A5_9MYCO|nr:MspA family porin [Mycobacteroides franklinii]TDH18954.1 porin [Mycobacteroides franklinii]